MSRSEVRSALEYQSHIKNIGYTEHNKKRKILKPKNMLAAVRKSEHQLIVSMFNGEINVFCDILTSIPPEHLSIGYYIISNSRVIKQHQFMSACLRSVRKGRCKNIQEGATLNAKVQDSMTA